MVNILVVDDEPIIANGIAKKIRSFAQAEESTVTAFTSSLQALAFQAEHDVDIIFTDINMPELNGMELIAAMKEKNPESQIIIITGFGSLSYAKQAMEFGVRHFLEKPVQPAQLATAYTDSLQRVTKRKANVKSEISIALEKYLAHHTTDFPAQLLRDDLFLVMFSSKLDSKWLTELQKLFSADLFVYGHYQNARYLLLKTTANEFAQKITGVAWGIGVFFTTPIKKESDYNALFKLGLASFEKEFYFTNYAILTLEDFAAIHENNLFANYLELKQQLPLLIHQQDFFAARELTDSFIQKCQTQLASVKQVQTQISDLISFLIETYQLSRDTTLQEASLRIVFSNQIQSLSIILHYCLEQISLQMAPLDSNNIPASLNYLIENHYDNEELSLRWIAKNMLFLNPDYMGRKYFQLTGNKFNSRLAEYRVQIAESLILNGKSINEVADAVGYKNNPEYFCQVFKKIKGTTPHRFLQLKN